MKKTSKVIAVFLCLVLLAGALAGCGNSGSSAPASSGSSAPASSGSSAPASSGSSAPASTGSSAPATPAVDTDRIIRVGTNRNPILLDPHTQGDMGSEAICRHVYAPIVSYTPDGEVHPNIAESWDIADDGMSITFHLRKDVTFHNGDPLTAEDIKFSFERQLSIPDERQYVLLMDDVDVIDDYTCRVNLNTPAPAVFLVNVSGAASTIVPKNYTEKMEAEGKSISDAPIGCGPYKFVSFTSYDECVLERWDDFWGEKPANAGLTFKIITDDAAKTIALETGEIDFLVETPTIDYSRIDENPDLVLEPYDTAWMEYLCINNQKAPFDDIRVRQALSYLVDRDAIVAIAENGHGTPLYCPAAKGDISYTDLENKYPYNVEKAKELLAEAGYPNGFEVEILTGQGYREQTAVVLQQSFEQAGIKVNVRVMETAALFEATVKGDHSLALMARNTDADPEAGIGPLYRSTATPEEGNRWFIRDPKIDEYFDAALVPTAMSERQKIYAEMHNYIMEQAYTIPLYTKDNCVSYAKGLTGAMLFPNGAHMYDQLHFE